MVVLVDGIERDAACLDREEVERITVLKDAASLALYGNRGADGIVAVTTRRRPRPPAYPYRLQFQRADPVPDSRLSRCRDLCDGCPTRRWKTTGSHPAIRSATSVRWCGERTDVLPNVDWRKAVLRNAGFNHDLNLSFDGSGGSMRYFVLANYNSNRGFLDNTDLNDGYSTQVGVYSLKLRSNLELHDGR